MLSEAFPDQAGSDVRRVFVDSGRDSRPVGTTGRERGSGEGAQLDSAGLTVILLRAGMQGQGEVIRHVFGDQRLPRGLDGVQFLKTFHDGLGDLVDIGVRHILADEHDRGVGNAGDVPAHRAAVEVARG